MNPMILNMLQQQGQQGGGMPMQGGMYQDYDMSQQQQAPAPDYNPFDEGINRANESARRALRMNPDQDSRAMRNAILAFGNSVGSQKKTRGFLGNLGQGLASLSPALQAHDMSEDAAFNENQALAEKNLGYRMQEDARRANMEDRDWKKTFAERQLSETRRAHDMQHSHDNSKNKAENKIWEVKARHNTQKEIPEISKHYATNAEILPTISEMKNVLSNSKLAGASKFAQVKRFIAKQTGADEDVLNAKNLGQFYLEWMNQNVKGTQSDKDMQLYQDTFADIEKNPKGALKVLERLEKRLSNQQGRYKKQLESYDIDPASNLNALSYFDQASTPEEMSANDTRNDDTNSNGMVKVRDIKTGEIIPITQEDAAQLSSEEFEVIDE